jgi:hypothetical protein
LIEADEPDPAAIKAETKGASPAEPATKRVAERPVEDVR